MSLLLSKITFLLYFALATGVLALTKSYGDDVSVEVQCRRLADLPPGSTEVPFFDGESVKLWCRALLNASVTWSKDGIILNKDRCPPSSVRGFHCSIRGPMGGRLFIAHLSATDEGEIRCHVENSSSLPITITVTGKTPDDTPVILKTWNQTAVAGRNATVVFITKNADIYTFTSRKAGLIDTGHGSKYDNRMNGKLRIVTVNESDEGWIMLRAMNSNSGNTETAFVYLHVQRSEDAVYICTNITCDREIHILVVQPEQTVTLHCRTASGDVLDAVSWTRGGIIVKKSDCPSSLFAPCTVTGRFGETMVLRNTTENTTLSCHTNGITSPLLTLKVIKSLQTLVFATTTVTGQTPISTLVNGTISPEEISPETTQSEVVRPPTGTSATTQINRPTTSKKKSGITIDVDQAIGWSTLAIVVTVAIAIFVYITTTAYKKRKLRNCNSRRAGQESGSQLMELTDLVLENNNLARENKDLTRSALTKTDEIGKQVREGQEDIMDELTALESGQQKISPTSSPADSSRNTVQPPDDDDEYIRRADARGNLPG